MTRARAAVLALAGVAVLCALVVVDRRGDSARETHPAPAPAPPPAAPVPPPTRVDRPSPVVRPRGPAMLVVTVLDGDTRRRVRGAHVTIGARTARTDEQGEARIRVQRRAPLLVTTRARGYREKTVRMPFQERRLVTKRIYQHRLQWPMYGADPARTKAHSAIRLRPPFRVVWSRGVGSLIEFPAVVSDGIAYVGNYRGAVYAIEMRRGTVVWTFRPQRGKMASSPAVAGDDLVVHGMDGVVRVLDRWNGRLRWQKRIGSPIESSPVVRDGVDYFGAWNGRVYALDLRTRKLRWTHRAGGKITASAALHGGTLFIGTYRNRVLALSTATGKARWVRRVDGRVYGAAAVGHGRVFVPSSTGRSVTAFTLGGRRLWRVRTGGWVYSSPAVWGGRVYFGSHDGHLYAVSAPKGRRLWRVRVGGRVSASPVVVAGVVYAGSTKGRRILGVDGRNGRVLMRFPHGQYVPVSGNGGRLLFHGYSRIYAVEPRRS
jgi:outer membrane protein assembly factor BamB